MKNKLLLLVLFISSIVIFLLINIKYPYKENELYNQNDILGYSEKKDESSNLINRNEAIKIATYILKNVLDIDINSKNSQVYINIYIGGINNDDYNWNISWSKNDLSGNYGIEINSNTGEINEIYINQIVNNEDAGNGLSDEEIISLVDELTNTLGFDLSNYSLSTKNIKNYNVNGVKTNYRVCTFINKNDYNDKFIIIIDCNGKFITNYRRNPDKEVS